MDMKRLLIILFTACTLLSACGKGNDSAGMKGSSGGGSIDIMSPAEGAQVSANQPLDVQYKLNKSPNGNHLHISVDNGKPDVVRQLEGTYKTGPLSPGEHTITFMEATSDHAPTGVQAVLHVKAE
jgi:hypothetical protein